MKTALKLFDIRDVVPAGFLKPTIILISSSLLLSLHRVFGSIEFAESALGSPGGITASVYMFVSASILMGLIPLLIVLFAFRDRPSEYGIGIGDWKAGLRMTAIMLPVILIGMLYPASQTEEIRSFYPLAPEAAASVSNFMLLQTPRILLFYAAWEFFFRGFMLFGLRPYVGNWLAICIQTIPQCLWHIGLPTGEMLSSIAGGILFGIMAVRTGSILWPFLLHCLIAVSLDLLIITVI
jgi:membrane protease YdiL (CAAX protease family)